MTTRPRIHLASLGCAKNLVDSEKLLARLAESGGLVGASPEEADVIIVNTCGFIGPAKLESIDVIGEYGACKEADPEKRLLVIGCLVERDRDALRVELPFVDGFFGLGEHEAIVAACGLAAAEDDGARLLLTPAHTAYLRISEGCDNRCTYCTIPLIRGPFRSRRPDAILREAAQLAKGSVRELNLIGQDTTAYGADLSTTYLIDQLLRDMSEIEPVRWLRLLYTHPAHFTDNLIEAFGEIPKLCSYVDLPLQHLDDEILARMGRRVTQAESLRLIERLRSRVPGIAIRTTFILGFPGETETQFEGLLSLIRQIRFDHLGAFAYSPEKGTAAVDFPNPVPAEERTRRVDEMMRIQQEIAFEKNRERVDTQAEVLLDEPTEDADVWIGRSRTQAPDVDGVTIVLGSNLDAGRFLDVRITGTDGYDLVAEPLD
ncbi:30S ribosomal protein S12 methylthiotransferase RimO [Candidatus Bipolaricaulota bacterium]